MCTPDRLSSGRSVIDPKKIKNSSYFEILPSDCLCLIFIKLPPKILFTLDVYFNLSIVEPNGKFWQFAHHQLIKNKLLSDNSLTYKTIVCDCLRAKNNLCSFVIDLWSERPQENDPKGIDGQCPFPHGDGSKCFNGIKTLINHGAFEIIKPFIRDLEKHISFLGLDYDKSLNIYRYQYDCIFTLYENIVSIGNEEMFLYLQEHSMPPTKNMGAHLIRICIISNWNHLVPLIEESTKDFYYFCSNRYTRLRADVPPSMLGGTVDSQRLYPTEIYEIELSVLSFKKLVEDRQLKSVSYVLLRSKDYDLCALEWAIRSGDENLIEVVVSAIVEKNDHEELGRLRNHRQLKKLIKSQLLMGIREYERKSNQKRITCLQRIFNIKP